MPKGLFQLLETPLSQSTCALFVGKRQRTFVQNARWLGTAVENACQKAHGKLVHKNQCQQYLEAQGETRQTISGAFNEEVHVLNGRVLHSTSSRLRKKTTVPVSSRHFEWDPNV
uniref:Uncharacterized protein n=1 Tax=Chromera velia CCMP2878 TaxID=1169474 RepID=A0A0G4I2C8_9ALVE|eukprot:Cvel_10333.t1-p1 / transcript=Cvel_10333.t1 / gene=Cvel_10333 / organism=Chromera_velia_CCMP2878 / gene_product=hypothetical protein / transcript_product=hypothetical protein / location=Cvel_scaffold620:68707-69045(+) / protein_length=113 / sequence_SO=supercontig / SO=protein_coding / is_pseudo=false